jgi:hypothetical protein
MNSGLQLFDEGVTRGIYSSCFGVVGQDIIDGGCCLSSQPTDDMNITARIMDCSLAPFRS